ncbi:MAG: DUF2203 domain-containing protein [Myxococcales bacterium]
MPIRLFTLFEANTHIPTLELEFAEMARWRIVADEAVRLLGGEARATEILAGGPVPEGAADAAAQLRKAAKFLQGSVRRVQAIGCVIKDLELGLVDFPSAIAGRTVNLCWQFGEPEVAHFHELDEGFARRRPLLPTVDAVPLRH